MLTSLEWYALALLFMQVFLIRLQQAIDVLCCTSPYKRLYEKYLLLDEEWDMIEIVIRFLEVRELSILLYLTNNWSMCQVFRKASERMAGEKYPTLSFSLVTYVKLIDEVKAFRLKTKASGELATAINACEAKLKKYFVASSIESIYYYMALSKSQINIKFDCALNYLQF